MSHASLDQRVTTLEEQVKALMAKIRSPPAIKDWSSTVGMFAGDSVMKEIDEEGRKIRDEDREQVKSDCS